MSKRQPVLGLALGSGSARGWAHIGVLRALEAQGITPDIVCGCSIGAFVGAAYVNGDLDKLETWVSQLDWKAVVGLLDVRFNGGLIKGEKLVSFFTRHFVDHDFSELSKPFACVATDLETGREIWLRNGSVAEAVRISIAMPGLFAPVLREGRLLVDGALVNPVPVSLCRALGAEVVLAVSLGSERIGHSRRDLAASPESWTQRVMRSIGMHAQDRELALPSLLEVLGGSLNIMQTRIERSRMAGEPAEVVLAPRLAQLGLMDYHRGAEAIAEGIAEVERMLPAILHAVAS